MNLKSGVRYISGISISVSMMFAACGTSTTETETVLGKDSIYAKDEGRETKTQEVFNSIPSPTETTSLLKSAGAKYDPKYLNPIENVSKYSSTVSKALNLGIYGSDLSFTSIFDQTQESMLYLRCTNRLASGLGISGAFDENTTSRLEANMNNRDSLLSIISESYWTSDAYLRNNGQAGISSLIIAGGWIEGLYIATQVANDTKNEVIISRIAEQKSSLEKLIALLDSYKSENTSTSEILDSFTELKKVYDTLPVEHLTDKNDKTTPPAGSSNKLSPEQLQQITDKATEIRNKFIQ